jgi:basic membrane protein A
MKKVLVMLLSLVVVIGCFAGLTACANDDVFKVGVIHIGDPADGAGYSYTHDLGIQAMQAELGLRDDQIVRKINVADDDNAAIRAAIEACIAEGCDIIFTTSYGYMDTTAALAEEYPDVIFSHGTGYKSNETNFNNYFGRIYQSRYLAGVVAGLNMSLGGNAGYVAAFTDELAETASGINAFALGIQAVNPEATLYVKSLNSWYDPTNEKDFATALIETNNCEVIAQHCDTANPMIAAKEKGKYGVGYNSDMSTTSAGDSVLTSVVWNWGVYYTAATKAAMEGKWAEFMANGGKEYYSSYADGICSIVKTSLDEKELAYVAAVEKLFNEGTWDVFSGKVLSFSYDETAKTATATPVESALLKNDNTPAGVVDDGVIKGTMNYLVKGVVKA